MPKSEESLKWGAPYYSIDGIGIASIAEYTRHVNLYLFSGAKLSSNLLEGTDKGMRHIKIRSTSDIKEKAISKLLKQAAALQE